MLTDGQISITRPNGSTLTLHHGTVYRVNEFEPFDRGVRAGHTGDAAWGDGGWSGAQWRSVPTIPVRLGIHTSSWAELMDAWWALDAALAPVRTGGPVELRWMAAGTEYLMYANPGGARLGNTRGRTGIGWVTASFTCPDSSIYSGTEYSVELGLYQLTGGLSVPFSVPFGIYSVVADGETTLINAGITPAALRIRIPGPVPEPQVVVIGPDNVARTLTFDLELAEDEWLDVDTAAETVLLNGSVTRLSSVSGTWPLLYPGTSTIQYRASTVTASRATFRFRDTY